MMEEVVVGFCLNKHLVNGSMKISSDSGKAFFVLVWVSLPTFGLWASFELFRGYGLLPNL